MKEKLYIFYRGPLERTRLLFIFELLSTSEREVEFIGIFPGRLNSKKRGVISGFLTENLKSVKILEDKWYQYFSTLRTLKKLIGGGSPIHIAAIGYSSLIFLRPFKEADITWFINGIPEEKSMQAKNFISKAMPKIFWYVNKFFAPKPKKIITVSGRMSAYVSKYFKNIPTLHAPTCADLEVFRIKVPEKKGYMMYCGTGAPWQAIDLMKAVWEEIHRLDPAMKFRVISRDERCKILGEKIKASSIEFVQSSDHRKVAEYLHECNWAFMLRRDDIVNRVCFPTKFAQYIASGCAVITTNIDWDVRDYMSDEIGMLVDPEESPEKIARKILSFLKNFQTAPMKIASHADRLDRNYWVTKTRAELTA